MKLHPKALLGVAVVVVAIVLGVVLIGGSDDDAARTAASGASAGQVDKAAADAAGQSKQQGKGKAKAAKPGPAPPAFSGDVEEAKKGGESIDTVYDNYAKAVDDGVVKLPRDIPVFSPAVTVAEQAEGNESLQKICDFMSVEAQQQTVQYVKVSAGRGDVTWDCPKAVALLLWRSGQSSKDGLKSLDEIELVGVNAEGDRATASIRRPNDVITSIPLVKEDGEWKLAASPDTSKQEASKQQEEDKG